MNLKQSRTTSLGESALNTGSGFLLSLACQWAFLVLVEGLPMTWHQNLRFALVMTVVSIARSYAWRRLFEARRASFVLSPFLLSVLAERQRQIDVKGYDARHDDQHEPGEIARAAACHLYAGSITDRAAREEMARTPDAIVLAVYPWDWEFWKTRPEDRQRDIVVGSALGLAEGELMERNRRRRRGPSPAPSSLPPGHYCGMGACVDVPAPPSDLDIRRY